MKKTLIILTFFVTLHVSCKAGPARGKRSKCGVARETLNEVKVIKQKTLEETGSIAAADVAYKKAYNKAYKSLPVYKRYKQNCNNKVPKKEVLDELKAEKQKIIEETGDFVQARYWYKKAYKRAYESSPSYKLYRKDYMRQRELSNKKETITNLKIKALSDEVLKKISEQQVHFDKINCLEQKEKEGCLNRMESNYNALQVAWFLNRSSLLKW